MLHGTTGGRPPFKTILRQVLDEFERSYLKDVLERHDHDLSAVRRSSGLSTRELWRLLRKHRLDAEIAPASRNPAPDDHDDHCIDLRSRRPQHAVNVRKQRWRGRDRMSARSRDPEIGTAHDLGQHV